MTPLFAGVDLGTSGVRTLIADSAGKIYARASASLQTVTTDGMYEQNPGVWWKAVIRTVRAVMQNLHNSRVNINRLAGIAVDGTSGTLVCTDGQARPVGRAIMYNDTRAAREAKTLQDSGHPNISVSWALPKALWIKHCDPKRFAKVRRLLHQADWISGKLCGSFDTTDYCNALKMGVDLDAEDWPNWIDADIRPLLPSVVPPGTQIGTVTKSTTELTGLPFGLPVLAGSTDGVAACLASGLHRFGDYSTSLGSTLTFKSISRSRPRNSLIYAHKLPGGLWLPGAASNTGGAWIQAWFRNEDLHVLDRSAETLLPTPHVTYPLIGRGERFPFAHARLIAHIDKTLSGPDLFAACLQGTACVERMSYAALDAAMGTNGGAVYSTGGGSQSDVWMQLRADLCNRTFHRPACTDAAMGAAILAATGTHFESIQTASFNMTRVHQTFHPKRNMNASYANFLNVLNQYRNSLAS